MPTPTIRVSQLPAIGTPDNDNLLLVSILSATVTITATTISAQASDNSFNDSANGFGAFAVDDQIQVTGFTGNVANNLYSGTVTVATAGTLTIGGTDGDVIVDEAAGDSVTITKWESVRMTLTELAAFVAAAAGGVWDAHAFYPGVPAASALVLRIPSARAVNFAANFAGSYGVASDAATASTVFDVQKNGASIGSITFAAAATTATFTTTGGTAQTLAAGDVLAIIAPATPDATLANVGIALAGTR